jgi:hemoglobin
MFQEFRKSYLAVLGDLLAQENPSWCLTSRAYCVSFETMTESLKAGSLFERLGGRAAITDLLRHFYADVRQHHVIGPIFLAQIDDWPAHLAKIADFWAGATGGPARYSGPMPQKHFPLGLGPGHFEAWLDLWRRQCRIRLPEPEADEMIRLAEGIGERLRQLIAQNQSQSSRPG